MKVERIPPKLNQAGMGNVFVFLATGPGTQAEAG
jgi:hypothetical protein